MITGAANIEEALTLTGYGKFNYLLSVCCALSLLSSGIENGINAFFLPVAQCELQLTSSQIGSLNAFFLIGGICSAILWGLLADLIGRKKVLVYALLGDWVILILASFSSTYLMLLILRFLNGFLTGAPAILTYSYYGEFHCEKHRNKAVCFIGIFFNLFWLVLPGMAWVIMPLPWEFSFFGTWITSWRLFIIFLSTPTIISGIGLTYFPESPNFLMSKGDSKEALVVISKMFSINTGKTVENFEVKILVNNLNLKKVLNDTNNSLKTVGRGKLLRLLKDAKGQIIQLFSPPLLVYTILTSAILFCNMFGYLGLGLWIPEILSRFEEFHVNRPNKSITLCELQNLIDDITHEVAPIFPYNLTHYRNETEVTISCEKSIDTKIFINTSIIGACVVIANVVVAIFAGNFKRKTLPIVTMLISTVSAGSINWLTSSTQHLISGSLFQASAGVGNIVLSGVIVDIFPTSVGAMAICTSILFGRLGAVVANLVFGFLLDASCQILLLIIVITLLGGTILCFFIPTNNISMKEEIIEPKQVYKSVSELSVISTL